MPPRCMFTSLVMTDCFSSRAIVKHSSMYVKDDADSEESDDESGEEN